MLKDFADANVRASVVRQSRNRPAEALLGSNQQHMHTRRYLVALNAIHVNISLRSSKMM